MNFKQLAVSGWLIAVCCYLFAADISAPKMEIVDSPQGRMTVFSQGIIITDKDTKIIGKYAIFYEKENRATITDSLLITNPQFTIRADTAYYSFDEKKTLLRGNVSVESDTLLIESPSLTFEQSKSLVKARERVMVKEKIQNITAFGKYAEYNFNDAIGFIDSSPVLHIERNDTTVVTGDKIILNNRESRFSATDRVSVITGNTTLKCDTLLFFLKDNFGLALGNPNVFDRQNHIKGDTIKFYFTAEDSSESDQNQVSLKKVNVLQMVNATYYTEDGGRLEIQGDMFSINYRNGDITSVQVFSDTLNYVTGKFIPKDEL